MELHLLNLDHLIAVALLAEFFGGGELVEFHAVALGALDLLLVVVNLVACGIPYLFPLGVLGSVAFEADFGVDHGVLRYVRGGSYNAGEEEAHAFSWGEFVADMAGLGMHGAGSPGLVGLLHEVAGGAELRVVLGVLVAGVGGNREAEDGDGEDDGPACSWYSA